MHRPAVRRAVQPDSRSMRAARLQIIRFLEQECSDERGEQGEADGNQQTGVEPFHQPRNNRDQHELRKACPRQDRADLLGVVTLDACEMDRKNEDGAVVRYRAGNWRGCRTRNSGAAKGADSETAARWQLDPQKKRQRDSSNDRQPDDERRAEPVILVTLLEHGLQCAKPDRHKKLVSVSVTGNLLTNKCRDVASCGSERPRLISGAKLCRSRGSRGRTPYKDPRRLQTGRVRDQRGLPAPPPSLSQGPMLYPSAGAALCRASEVAGPGASI